MTAAAENGVKAPLTAEPQGPPWRDVDPWAIIDQLQATLAARDTEMAAMRVYIGQLHQGLQAAAAKAVAVPAEEQS